MSEGHIRQTPPPVRVVSVFCEICHLEFTVPQPAIYVGGAIVWLRIESGRCAACGTGDGAGEETR